MDGMGWDANKAQNFEAIIVCMLDIDLVTMRL